MTLQILQHTDTAQEAHVKAVIHYCAVSQGTRQLMRPQISLINSCVFVTFLFLSTQYDVVC